MKRVSIIALSALSLSALAICPSCSSMKEVEKAIANQVQLHPATTLQDVYKSFYQDEFGPGHMISDPEAVRAYMESELAADDYLPGEARTEPTGSEGRYTRVSLALVKEGVISEDELLEAFLAGAKSVSAEDLQAWKRKWPKICDAARWLGLKGYDRDRSMLDSLLSLPEGSYAVHHSRQYAEAYHPHYRIVETQLFEKLMEKNAYRIVDAEHFNQALRNPAVVALDVRTAEEYAEYHIPGIYLNIDVLKDDFAELVQETIPAGSTVAIHCRSGRRSKTAAKALLGLGYRVIELGGGINEWQAWSGN